MIRTSISPSSAVELNTTSALANYATEAGWHRNGRRSDLEIEFTLGVASPRGLVTAGAIYSGTRMFVQFSVTFEKYDQNRTSLQQPNWFPGVVSRQPKTASSPNESTENIVPDISRAKPQLLPQFQHDRKILKQTQEVPSKHTDQDYFSNKPQRQRSDREYTQQPELNRHEPINERSNGLKTQNSPDFSSNYSNVDIERVPPKSFIDSRASKALNQQVPDTLLPPSSESSKLSSRRDETLPFPKASSSLPLPLDDGDGVDSLDDILELHIPDPRFIFFIPDSGAEFTGADNFVGNSTVLIPLDHRHGAMRFRKEGLARKGRNPSCPKCHPAYLLPGRCEPCVVIR
uniref:Uncharacterized protein n=1 Tax=Timema genevievae TaxID=629358 RepID=A0A7R9JX61_TIMGE|nr:unnamed protein product [Timema genevievae]